MGNGRKCKSPKDLQAAFLKDAGAGIRTLKAIMDTLPMVAFYLKDAEGRIMALNPFNCEICNVRSEEDALGKKSSDLFPALLAESYMARDKRVLSTGLPIVGALNTLTADRSSSPRRTNTFPVFNQSGQVIGTACASYRAADVANVDSWHARTRLEPAIRHFERHFAEHISIPALARLVGMSETHFRRCFNDAVGCTPLKYLTTMRINAARELLEKTNRTIADIAQETGFSDHAHFIRTFRALRNMSPGEYRRRHGHI